MTAVNEMNEEMEGYSYPKRNTQHSVVDGGLPGYLINNVYQAGVRIPQKDPLINEASNHANFLKSPKTTPYIPGVQRILSSASTDPGVTHDQAYMPFNSVPDSTAVPFCWIWLVARSHGGIQAMVSHMHHLPLIWRPLS